MAEKDEDFNVEDLLSNLFKPKETLRELFDRRIKDLQITPTSVLEMLKIEYRPLNGILDGTQKRVDFTNLMKLSEFLQIPREQVVQLYMEALEKNYFEPVTVTPDKIKFIKEHFDLVVLKKAGFISSLSNFAEIESRIVSFFGLKSLFDYKREYGDVAFSAGKLPGREQVRDTWIHAAQATFREIDNPYPFDRKALVDFFPQIRWYSTNVELGLTNVIKEVYKRGVTIVYQPPLHSLHLRGATFAVDNKPCIAITRYTNYYPTLWFALVHELFHVIFDWDEIKNNHYHLSIEETALLPVVVKEKEADEFAREYLFSKEKTQRARAHMHDPAFIQDFALSNHVHPSFVYVFNAFDLESTSAWARATKENPPVDGILKSIGNAWDNPKPISEFVKTVKPVLYQ